MVVAMHVDQLIARVRSRIATMQTTAEEYEIEARFHADKALDLRLGVMELNQLINSVQEFVDGEPDETPASSRPGSEVAASDAAAASAGEAFPSASPAPHSAAPVSLDATTDPAKLAAEEPSSDGSGEVQDRCESTSPTLSEDACPHDPDGQHFVGCGCDATDSAEAPMGEAGTASSSNTIPTFSGGSWVRGDQAAVDADNEEQDLVEVLAHEKAPDPAPAGGAATSPAPIQDRVQALYDAHPEYTARQAREALDLTKGSLSGHSSALGITWAPADFVGRPVSSSKMDRVRTVHEQHPTWTARMIANHLGEKETSVSTMLATIRKRASAAPSKPEFAGEAALVGHYSDVAKRLGKP